MMEQIEVGGVCSMRGRVAYLLERLDGKCVQKSDLRVGSMALVDES
jgi:hypothetical protein